MKYYRVIGEIEVVENCECEFCEGHSEFLPINEIVLANDGNDAIAKIYKITEFRQAGDCDWSMNPSVEEIPEENFMRLHKQPEFQLAEEVEL